MSFSRCSMDIIWFSLSYVMECTLPDNFSLRPGTRFRPIVLETTLLITLKIEHHSNIINLVIKYLPQNSSQLLWFYIFLRFYLVLPWRLVLERQWLWSEVPAVENQLFFNCCRECMTHYPERWNSMEGDYKNWMSVGCDLIWVSAITVKQFEYAYIYIYITEKAV